jgi:hypothetical protein
VTVTVVEQPTSVVVDETTGTVEVTFGSVGGGGASQQTLSVNLTTDGTYQADHVFDLGAGAHPFTLTVRFVSKVDPDGLFQSDSNNGLEVGCSLVHSDVADFSEQFSTGPSAESFPWTDNFQGAGFGKQGDLAGVGGYCGASRVSRRYLKLHIQANDNTTGDVYPGPSALTATVTADLAWL